MAKKKKKHKNNETVTVPYEPTITKEVADEYTFAHIDILNERIDLLEKTIITQAIEIRKLTDLVEYHSMNLTLDDIVRRNKVLEVK